MHHVLLHHGARDVFHFVNGSVMNSYDTEGLSAHCWHQYRRGDFLLHFPGIKPAHKQRLFDKWWPVANAAETAPHKRPKIRLA